MSIQLSNNNNVSWASPILITLLIDLLLFIILVIIYRHFKDRKKRLKNDEKLDVKIDD